MSEKPHKKSQTEQRFANKTLRMAILYPLFFIVTVLACFVFFMLFAVSADGSLVGLFGINTSIALGLLALIAWVLLSRRTQKHQKEWFGLLNRLRGIRQEDERIETILHKQFDDVINPRLIDDNNEIELEIYKSNDNNQQLSQS